MCACVCVRACVRAGVRAGVRACVRVTLCVALTYTFHSPATYVALILAATDGLINKTQSLREPGDDP